MTSSQSSRLILTVPVTRGLQGSVWVPFGFGGANLRAVAEVDGHQGGMGGQRGGTRGDLQRGDLGGLGQGHRQRGRDPVLHDVLRCGPRGTRVAVGGGVGRCPSRRSSRSRRGVRGARLGGSGRPAPGPGAAGPTPSGVDRNRFRHRQRPAQVDQLLGRQRHRRGAVHAVGGLVQPGRPKCPSPGPTSRPAHPRRTRHLHGVPQVDRVRDSRMASYWVIDRSVMPNWTPDEPLSVAERP